jgi:hypothetical protein
LCRGIVVGTIRITRTVWAATLDDYVGVRDRMFEQALVCLPAGTVLEYLDYVHDPVTRRN